MNQSPFIELLVKDDILIGTYRDDLRIDLKIARQVVADRLAFTEGKIMPAMILASGVAGIDKAAREFLASGEGTRGLSATAIVARSPFGSLMGNFFMMVNHTRIPVKMFSDRDKAELWLKQFVDRKSSLYGKET